MTRSHIVQSDYERGSIIRIEDVELLAEQRDRDESLWQDPPIDGVSVLLARAIEYVLPKNIEGIVRVIHDPASSALIA